MLENLAWKEPGFNRLFVDFQRLRSSKTAIRVNIEIARIKAGEERRERRRVCKHRLSPGYLRRLGCQGRRGKVAFNWHQLRGDRKSRIRMFETQRHFSYFPLERRRMGGAFHVRVLFTLGRSHRGDVSSPAFLSTPPCQ